MQSRNLLLSSKRVVRARLLLKSDGNAPLKLLYPKSKTSSSIKSPISFGIFPENELLRKIIDFM